MEGNNGDNQHKKVMTIKGNEMQFSKSCLCKNRLFQRKNIIQCYGFVLPIDTGWLMSDPYNSFCLKDTKAIR